MAKHIQLITGDGKFNNHELNNFLQKICLRDCGNSYVIVSIMGSQSSGKSTLLNYLFDTKFEEMDAHGGRSQTTKGIWLADCTRIEPRTLVMDLEGTDSTERGENDTSFEKQSALFALTVSDILIINIWCIEIGREHAANRPLLKTVFQVMLQLFPSSAKFSRKKALLFVIRDKSKTPVENLERLLKKDVQEIWDSVPKPEAYQQAHLGDFFNVEVAALSSFEHREEDFKKDVYELRQRFVNSTAPRGLAGDRRGVVPASGFCLMAHEAWNIIKDNNYLRLHDIKTMVATVRCKEIAREKFKEFIADAKWQAINENAKQRILPDLEKSLSAILEVYLSRYDKEAVYFDDNVRMDKRQKLESVILKEMHPAYKSTVSQLLEKAKYDIDETLQKSLKEGIDVEDEYQLTKQRYVNTFSRQCDEAGAWAGWKSPHSENELCSYIDDVMRASILKQKARRKEKHICFLIGAITVGLHLGFHLGVGTAKLFLGDLSGLEDLASVVAILQSSAVGIAGVKKIAG